MHSYFIDKEHKSCLNTDEDNQSHLDTVQDQRSMGHDPFLSKQVNEKTHFFADVNHHPFTQR